MLNNFQGAQKWSRTKHHVTAVWVAQACHGWASVAAMAHGSRWELVLNAHEYSLQIAVCTMCNLSTSQLQTECHIHAEIWPITGIWPNQLISQLLVWCTMPRLLSCDCSAQLRSFCVVYVCEQMSCLVDTKIAIWVCHKGAMSHWWQLVGHLMMPKGTGPDENSSFDAHGCWELLQWCMWWNLSTWSRQTKSYKLWHSSEVCAILVNTG